MIRLHKDAIALVASLALIAATSSAAAGEAPLTIMAVDVSGSSTFAFDQQSADAAGAFIKNYIDGRTAPHQLRMVSVGDAGLGRRVIDIRATVTESRASSAKRLASQFGGYFRTLPELVQSGRITAQDTTSLVDFFRSLEPVCAVGNVTVILFSDGIEWSAAVDGRALIAGKATLPTPETPFLKGCAVSLLGVGEVKSTLSADGLAARLIPQWQAFLTAAGAEPVTVVGSGFSF